MIERGKLLFDETNLPIIIQRKNEIWHSRRIRSSRIIIYSVFIPIFILSLFFLLFYDSSNLIEKFMFLCFIFLIIVHSIVDFIAYMDKKKDLIIYENGMTIPVKPASYVLRHKNWYVPFSKIDSITKENDLLIIKFKDKFSRDHYISIKYIHDWLKFKTSLENKVKLDL